MSQQVRVSSIDALEAFRGDLLQFVETARMALEDASGEVRRTRSWLDLDRANHWTRQCKQRAKQLEIAEAELYNVTLTSPQESHAFQKLAVARARRQLEQAEDKLRVVQHWRRIFENRTTPLLRQLEPLYFLIGRQLPSGIHSLGEAIQALQAYAAAPAAAAPPPTEPMPSEGGAP